MGRPFYIVSELPFNKVVEMNARTTNISIRRWRKNATIQQFWFDGVSKTIRNWKHKNYCLDIYGNGSASKLRMNGVLSRWW